MPPDGEGAAVGALNMEKENMSKWKQMYKMFPGRSSRGGSSRAVSSVKLSIHQPLTIHFMHSLYVNLKPKFCTVFEKYLDIAR